jgi:hypothetical protein
MASFNVPSRIVTKQVADGNIVVIQTAAASAMSTIDPNALEILDIQAKWASDALKNRLNCDSHKLIAALRRLELANLEVARRAAVDSTEFNDWRAALTPEMVDALTNDLDVTKPDFTHRRALVDALFALRNLEKQMNTVEERAAKGKKGRRQLTTA